NLQVAAAVSMDGFLIDAARAEGVELDPEEFAALATNGVMVVKALGRGINLGDISSAIFEYRDGSVVVSTLDDDFALALLAGNEALRRIRGQVRSTFGPQVLADVGHFGGLYALPGEGETVLVASADGVGTKLKLAFALDRHDTIGVDLVNHCVDDILACGARPLFFLDYFATGALAPAQLEAVVAGLAAACRDNGCALLGGETAELPGFYAPGEYDLAGFIVGVMERASLKKTNAVKPGDLVLALPTTGLHTNGYSLARKLVFEHAGLQPESYVAEVSNK